MPAEIPTRIATYGLTTGQVQPLWTDLTVPDGKKVRLSRHSDTDVASHAKQLSPKTVADLKRIISVPDPPVSAAAPRILKRPRVITSTLSPQITAEQHAALWGSAYNAIFGGKSGAVSISEIASVNKWLAVVNPRIWIWLYQDITVGENAQLVLAPDVSILFANDIVIEQGGQIICQGSIIKFDCASLTGVDGPLAGTGTGTS